jgi:pimeloyl-ACP methyl ester carboxylesterase
MGFLHAMYQLGFNVVAFDPRGHGHSSGRRGDYTINSIVDDALAVVGFARHRFNSKVALVGSSQGGIAAFYVAAKDDTLDAVVCHNLADLNGRENIILSRLRPPRWLVPVAKGAMTLYRSFAIPISLYLDLSKEYLEDGTQVSRYIKKDPLCVTWISLRAMNSLMMTPLTKSVEKIITPVMVVHSDQDHIFPQDYVESIFHRLTCPKEFLLLKQRSHLVMTNQVDQVAPKVADWLKGVMTPLP